MRLFLALLIAGIPFVAAAQDQAPFANVPCEDFGGVSDGARQMLASRGWEHAEVLPYVAFGLYQSKKCNWHLDKVAFIDQGGFRATQRNEKYVIFSNVNVSALVVLADSKEHPFAEGDPLPTGIYRVADIVHTQKNNGFPIDLPLVEFVSDVPNMRAARVVPNHPAN